MFHDQVLDCDVTVRSWPHAQVEGAPPPVRISPSRQTFAYISHQITLVRCTLTCGILSNPTVSPLAAGSSLHRRNAVSPPHPPRQIIRMKPHARQLTSAESAPGCPWSRGWPWQQSHRDGTRHRAAAACQTARSRSASTAWRAPDTSPSTQG